MNKKILFLNFCPYKKKIVLLSNIKKVKSTLIEEQHVWNMRSASAKYKYRSNFWEKMYNLMRTAKKIISAEMAVFGDGGNSTNVSYNT